MDILALSAEQILAFDKNSPERLFSLDGFEREFKVLRSKWHPDHSASSEATEVFKHVMDLAETAKHRITTNTWNGKAPIIFTTSKGKTFRIQYRRTREFELGRMYIGTNYVMYVLEPEFEDLFDNAVQSIKGIRYPDNKFKAEFARFLPKIRLEDKGTSIGPVLVVEKTVDVVLLQDLIDRLSGKIDAKHVAWITGSLYNITVFLDHIGVCHNSILPTTVFVSPEYHSVQLLGGWWYSTKKGDKLTALPSDLLRVLPSEVLKRKKTNTLYDRQATKAVAIACLGDSTMAGSKLLANKEIPNAMLTWLRLPSGTDAIEEFKGWYQMLERCFGERKFIKLDVNVDEVY